ncbi:MAG: insulinase family protein [Gammaproteobacteria bacterium]
MKSHSPTIERRFSRKALNIMTISVAIAIFLLSRTYTDSVSTTTSSTDKSPQENTSANLRPHLLDIKTQALNTAQPPITLPIQTWRHDTGAQLLFVESSEIPMLNIELIFDAGSARDTDLPGLARMTNNLIGEGSTQHSVEEIAQTFESLGSEFNTASERDMGVLSLKTLASDANLQASLNLFIEVLSQPSFPEAALTRVKSSAVGYWQRAPCMVNTHTLNIPKEPTLRWSASRLNVLHNSIVRITRRQTPQSLSLAP